MKSTQNEKISQIKFSTPVVGIDVAKETYYVRAFDSRGIKLSKMLKFSNTAEGFQRLEEWSKTYVSSIAKRILSSALNPQDVTGLPWMIT